MPLYNPAQIEILASVNNLNSAIITLDAVTFADPGVNTAVSGEALYGPNSTFSLKGAAGGNYEGSTKLAYNRLDLSTVFANQIISIPLRDPVDVWAALPYINRRLSTSFVQADLVNNPVNTTDKTILLQAHSKSLGWRGSITFGYTETAPQLLLIPDPELDGTLLPSGSAAKVSGLILCIDKDFSPHKALLTAAFPTKVSDTPEALTADQKTALVTALTAVLGNSWVASGAGDYTLEGATFIFHKGYSLTASFNKTICIDVPNSNLVGSYFYLQYN